MKTRAIKKRQNRERRKERRLYVRLAGWHKRWAVLARPRGPYGRREPKQERYVQACFAYIDEQQRQALYEFSDAFNTVLRTTDALWTDLT